MSEEYMYPKRYEIDQALNMCKRKFIDDFAQSRGILITNATQENLVDALSRLFFEFDDLEQIRKESLHIHNKSTLSGFLVETKTAEFNLVDHLSQKLGGVADERLQMTLKPPTRIQLGDKQVHKGSVEYVDWKPGRIEFLQGEDRAFEYYLYQINDCLWQVLVDCTKSNDAKVMEDWIKKETWHVAKLTTIEHERLSSPQTIRFFDELRQRGIDDKEWRFVQVTRLVLRKSTDEPTDDDGTSASPSALTGITQAILEGKELRDNPFVKQSEDGGYRFTAMTYQYEGVKSPNVMDVRAEFKGRPKVFEVALEAYKKREGLGEKLQDTNITEDCKVLILSKFWAEAKALFDELISES